MGLRVCRPHTVLLSSRIICPPLQADVRLCPLEQKQLVRHPQGSEQHLGGEQGEGGDTVGAVQQDDQGATGRHEELPVESQP